MGTKVDDLSGIVWDDEAAQTPEVEMPEVLPTSEGVLPVGEMVEAEDEKEAIDYTPIKPKEYTFPTLRPRRGTSKFDMAQLKRLGMIVEEIEDADDASKAREVLNSGARIPDIEKTIKIFLHKDRVAKANAKREAIAYKNAQDIKKAKAKEFSVDKKKTKEKYAQGAAAYKTMSTLLGRLTDNYKDDYVGWFDAPYNDTATVAPLPQEEGAGTYRQDFDAVFLMEKDAKNMGANFTRSEQAMLRATMPSLREKESVYKRKLTNYQRTMRDILANKLEASRKAGYKIGELEDAVALMNDGYENALDTFGLRDDPQFKSTDAPEDATPQRKIRTLGNPTQAQMSREDKLKFLKGEL